VSRRKRGTDSICDRAHCSILRPGGRHSKITSHLEGREGGMAECDTFSEGGSLKRYVSVAVTLHPRSHHTFEATAHL